MRGIFRKELLLLIVSLTALALLSGCGSSGRESGGDQGTAPPTIVGSDSCANNCHSGSIDAAGNQLADTWANTAHTINNRVQCESCHGPGSLHWGLGPIPYPHPTPAQSCYNCHSSVKTFDDTAHANPDSLPDKFFFQGDAGIDQANNRGVPEVTPSGAIVRKNQHIQECSLCHNPGQKFTYNRDRTLATPDPNDMPLPAVSCMGCHDVHQLTQRVTISQRTSAVNYPLFRHYLVNASGAQVAPLYDNTSGISWPTDAAQQSLAGIIYQPNGAVQPDGTVDYSKVVGRNNELSTEKLCAACHAKGKYLYAQTETHQEDVYRQYLNSGHADKNAAPFAEFSANPPAYVDEGTGKPYPIGDHRTAYPFDMALSTVGATANTTRNAGSGNYACFKCHNGLASRAWQDNVQGTSAAPVIFGDSTVTCLTCHDTHKNTAGAEFLVRKPVMMTNYSTSSVTIQGNVFLDTQPVPEAAGTTTICIFCHQGRESGYTLYKTKLAPGKTITGSFFNPHYLGTAAFVWAANGYEFAGKQYGGVSKHQEANCETCHMDNATVSAKNGGHSWRPNVATCNTADCHGGFGPVPAKAGTDEPDVAAYRAPFDTNNYSGDPDGATQPIAVAIRSLQNRIIAELAKLGIYYDDLNYPYFFKTADPATHTSANAFTNWTPAPYKAAFNLAFVIKGLPSAAVSQVPFPNASAAVHDYRYTIQLLQDSIQNLTGSYPANSTRPAGSRPATPYGQGQ